MAKHYTCDICDNTMDSQISLAVNRRGLIYLAVPATNIDMQIEFSITNPAVAGSEVCYNCIADELNKLINIRKEVVQQSR